MERTMISAEMLRKSNEMVAGPIRRCGLGDVRYTSKRNLGPDVRHDRAVPRLFSPEGLHSCDSL